MTSFSYIDHLECTICGNAYPYDGLATVSECCGKVLFVRYDLPRLRREVQRSVFDSRPGNMWRYNELLPVTDPDAVITLGEGGTPLLDATTLARRVGIRRLLIKEEGLNPTGTFKARGIAAAVSKAVEVGARGFTMPSAGNAAGAAAAYCARAGTPVKVFMPQDAPDANKKESIVAGSELNLVDGLIGDAGRIAVAIAAEQGLFDLSTLKEPCRAEGKKTMGLEIAHQLGWRMPDAIVYPTGGGTGLIGMWKAFDEMQRMGWIDSRRPRMIVVQASGCAPIVAAFEAGAGAAGTVARPRTVAAGLRVPEAIGDFLILDILRRSGGRAISVSDRELLAAVSEVAAAEGVFAAPEGAACVPALRRLRELGEVDRDDRVVLFNTGSGFKYLDLWR
jgi:threonine synthase